MAAFHYDDYRASDEGGTFAAVLNWGGAFLSLVLIAGLATWGWKLWVRDVTGVPVVRALEGPMRIAPEDPGGLASEYQGLTVNRIAENRAAEAASDQVVLAPAPATLNEDEDLAMAELPAVAPEPEEEVVLVNEPPTPAIGTSERIVLADDGYEDPLPADAEIAAAGATETAPLIVISETAEPSPEPAQSATDLAVAAALADAGLRPEPAVLKVEAAAHVPVVTPRPVLRPENLQTVAATAPLVLEGDIDVASIASGTRLVQLGAFGSRDDARTEWGAIQARYGDYFVGKSRVIQDVNSDGREFFRLRVMGFDDLADARRFCAVIVADGTNCIPVIHQ
ncbi:MAG: SPOR domain-containing protein [Pseudomonadota bacterium]